MLGLRDCNALFIATCALIISMPIVEAIDASLKCFDYVIIGGGVRDFEPFLSWKMIDSSFD